MGGRRTRSIPCASLSLLLALAGTAAAADRQWYTLSIDDVRIGYAWEETARRRGEITHTQHARIAISQFRRNSNIDRRIEVVRSQGGAPKRVEVTSKAGVDRGQWRGVVGSDQATLLVSADERKEKVTVELPPSLIFPDQLIQSLAALVRAPTHEVTLTYLDPARGEPTTLHARIKPAQSGVEIQTWLEDGSRDPETYWFDTQGALVRREQAFFGAILSWTPCRERCDRSVEQPFDPMARLTVRSPFHISKNALRGPIRYVISRTDEALPKLVATAEQDVVRNAHRVIVTVCERCGSEPPPSEAELVHYLQPNAWIQSTHPEIVAFARRSASGDSAERQMSSLTQAVRDRMTGAVNFLGYASALEALRHRSGDCTEIAALLAAVARAQGIPARVVIGLVYADRFSGKKDVFSPHAWVQAWDGERWRSFDAALDGFDASHIAIAIGNGDPRQFEGAFSVLPQLQIENAGLIRSK